MLQFINGSLERLRSQVAERLVALSFVQMQLNTQQRIDAANATEHSRFLRRTRKRLMKLPPRVPGANLSVHFKATVFDVLPTSLFEHHHI
ncbi:hypothetical protein ACVW1C_005887 [Bradyrhizobium sp. USDA 4011]